MSSTDIPPFEYSASTFRHTQSPNPTWTYGQKVEATDLGKEWIAGEKEGWKVIDTAKENPG